MCLVFSAELLAKKSPGVGAPRLFIKSVPLGAPARIGGKP